MKKALLRNLSMTFFLLSGFFINVSGQYTIASWSYDALIAPTASVPTASVIPADYGILSASATTYLDGTNGSSAWISVPTNPELTTFGGSAINDPRPTPIAGNALAVANSSANGKYVVFKFSTLGYTGISISFATRGTSTGFNTHTWEWSTDNITYTLFGTNTAVITSTFTQKSIDLSAVTAVNNNPTVYIRLTVTGASSAAGNNRIDNLVVSAAIDIAPPIASFFPLNAAIDVPVTINPTVTFNEPVRKTDGNPLENSDLSGLITFKKTNASGADVSFTATIDAAKKVITVIPSASLDNSQIYYLAVGPVEDAAGNESVAKSVNFTTISLLTPTVTVTYPNGGEVLYSGDFATITWTTANFDAGENVKIEVWLPVNAWYTLEASTPNDGSQVVLVGPDADYGTGYLIRVSGVTNLASDQSNNPFTVIATATTLADLKTNPVGAKIKYLGEAVITFIRTANRNQKYIQDASAGMLIDDPSGILTTSLAVGDKIKNLEGTLGTYTGMFQLVPTEPAVTIVSGGNTVTIPALTIAEYTTNAALYESMLIKIPNVTFTGADGVSTFSASTQYTVNDGTNNLAFFTFKAGESNIVGSIIPVGNRNITGLALKYNTTIEIASRTTADIEFLTATEKTSAQNVLMYPVPASSELIIRNMRNLRSIEVLDATGRVITTITGKGDEEIRIPVSSLRRGIYFIRFTTGDGKVIRKFIKS